MTLLGSAEGTDRKDHAAGLDRNRPEESKDPDVGAKLAFARSGCH